MEKTFIILNGSTLTIKTFTSTPDMDCEQLAYQHAVNWCDHSKEIIVRELGGVHNTTKRIIPSQNVQSFLHKTGNE